MKPGILYLHGFSSSPDSWKASLLAEAMEARGLSGRFFRPRLSHIPDEALAAAENVIRESKGAGCSLTLVGSSLGGFYATVLAERHGLRAVLINPVVSALTPLERYLGKQANLQTGEPFELTRDHLRQLEAMEIGAISPERYLLFVETGDETLNYREAMFRYVNARQYVMEGGDHGFTRFPEIVPLLFDFCGL
ncbi:MAG: alpha/beta fold hydrolase [Candidatus Accumulibacter sp.]|jgi:predicted esterase YcpF (UPF0227 family)|nr:alpha/beta fold hydrolase [Accumulibacter sp.]